MLDHVTIGVADLDRSKQFYDSALQPLGISRLYAEADRFAGYGIRPKAFFWIGVRVPGKTGAHIAFTANTAPLSTGFTRRRSRPGPRTTGRRDYARTIMRIITGPSCSIPTVTISRRSAMRRKARPTPSRPTPSRSRESES
jgi:hypothetical protein